MDLCKDDNLSTLRSVSTAFVNTTCRLCLCQAPHFHCTRSACFSQAHASCLKHFDFLKVKVQNTVPCNEVRRVDVLLSTFLRYRLIRLHTFMMYRLIRLHTFFLNLWNGNIVSVVHISRYIRRIPNSAIEASTVYDSVPRNCQSSVSSSDSCQSSIVLVRHCQP